MSYIDEGGVSRHADLRPYLTILLPGILVIAWFFVGFLMTSISPDPRPFGVLLVLVFGTMALLGLLVAGLTRRAGVSLGRKTPGSYRGLQIVLGALCFVFPILVLVYPAGTAVITAMLLILALIPLGLARLVSGIVMRGTAGVQALNITAGILFLVIIALLIAFPWPGARIYAFVYLTALGLLFAGAESVATSTSSPLLKEWWLRGMTMAGAAAALAAAFLVVLSPVEASQLLLPFLLSFVLVVHGVGSIWMGLGGRRRVMPSSLSGDP